MRYQCFEEGSRWVVRDTDRNYRMVAWRATRLGATKIAKERNDRELLLREAVAEGVKLVRSGRSMNDVVGERRKRMGR